MSKKHRQTKMDLFLASLDEAVEMSVPEGDWGEDDMPLDWSPAQRSVPDFDAGLVQDQIHHRAVSGDGYWCPTHTTREGVSVGHCCESRRWGKYGAAGVLFVHRETERFFLAQRSTAIHFGGTWGIPGGALDLGESAEEGARREVEEELGMGSLGRVVASYVDPAGDGWAYTTLVVEVDETTAPSRFDWETVGAGWFTISEMSTLRLHPGFRAKFWSVVRAWRSVGGAHVR